MTNQAVELATDNRPWHALAADEALLTFSTSESSGLKPDEAARRLSVFGENRLPEAGRPSWLVLLAQQFKQVLVFLLIGAAVVSFAIGERVDAAVIAVIVILNGLLGFFQEYRAEQALSSLQAMGSPHARVIRDGTEHEIDANDVVPGDLLLVAAGETVAADARLVRAVALRTDEAVLTGESTPVEKHEEQVAADSELADRASMLFRGTLVVAGRASAVVVATGGRTEMGAIAASMSRQRRRPTPLQQRLERLGRVLVVAALVLSGVVLVTSLIRGLGFEEGFLTAVSLSVAAVPEGLPAATTIVLALAVQRMAARQALVRRLMAVETLGSVTVICVDKTGTLTQNSMRVEEVWIDGTAYPVGGVPEAHRSIVSRLAAAAVSCNDAHIDNDGAGQGDPTEVALLDMAHRIDPSASRSVDGAQRLEEIPFDTARRRMTVHMTGAGIRPVLTKGAPELVVPRCATFARRDGDMRLDDNDRARVLGDAEQLAKRGFRVLAVADGDEASWPDERNLALIGMAAMADPLRAEARASILRAREAGIRVVMITGDHAMTARAIAEQAGLSTTTVVTGRELSGAAPSNASMLVNADVFARVTSEHKLEIVRALQAAGETVAMTGDGVNDAPALRAADIGVAMGAGGTDVARDAADLVLGDNNFETIVVAIEEGRTVFANLRGLIHFLLTCNLAEVAVVFGLLVAAGATPLLPVQILFVNLLTDSLPALALGVEPAEPDDMRSGPRQASTIFGKDSAAAILGIGGLIAIATMTAYAIGQATDGDSLASGMTLATLVGAQLAASLAFRSQVRSIFHLPRNLWLLAAIAGSALVLLAIFYVPLLQDAFDTQPLSPAEWLIVSALSLVPFIVVEAAKFSGLARRLPGVQ